MKKVIGYLMIIAMFSSIFFAICLSVGFVHGSMLFAGALFASAWAVLAVDLIS